MSEGNSYYQRLEDWIAGDLAGASKDELLAWASNLLHGEYHETETGLVETIHHKPGPLEKVGFRKKPDHGEKPCSPEYNRNRHALAILLARNAAPRDLLIDLAIAIAPHTQGNAYPIVTFVHTKENRQDALRRGKLHEEVYERVERGMSIEKACEEVAEKYGNKPEARTIHEIYKQLKPYRDSLPSRQPKDK